jgi:hypothetical protein
MILQADVHFRPPDGDDRARVPLSARGSASRMRVRPARHAAALGTPRRPAGRKEPPRRALLLSVRRPLAVQFTGDCWVRLGEPARAMRHYQELVDLLQEKLGVPPAAETTALYRRLADGP